MLLRCAGMAANTSPLGVKLIQIGIPIECNLLIRNLNIGFLDIDKLVEDRRPLVLLRFGEKPSIPQCENPINLYKATPLNLLQVTLSEFGKDCMPSLVPLHCSCCNRVVRGSSYAKYNHSLDKSICEYCFRTLDPGQEDYIKSYKHCVLADIITPEASRSICHCKRVRHIDRQGRPVSLFPVTPTESHRMAGNIEGEKCGLLKLPELVASAKYRGMQGVVVGKGEATEFKGTTGIFNLLRNWKGPSRVTSSSLIDTKERTATSGATTAFVEPAFEKLIPSFFKKYINEYPFGNVHMVLQVGPLLIENGVPE